MNFPYSKKWNIPPIVILTKGIFICRFILSLDRLTKVGGWLTL